MMPPNVLLIILDSVRAKNTQLHGYHRETTPFLDSFSDQATVYEEARAPSNQSITSHASLFTGTHAREHQLTNSDERLEPSHSIWEDLQERGYETGLFSDNPFLSYLSVGLKRGFDTVWTGEETQLLFPSALDPREYTTRWGEGGDTNPYKRLLRDSLMDLSPVRSFLNGVGIVTKNRWGATLKGTNVPLIPDAVTMTEVPGELFAEEFLRWQEQTDGSWAACINFMDAHLPYLPSQRFNRWGTDEDIELMRNVDQPVLEFLGGERPWSKRDGYLNLYDGAIRQVDHAVERTLTELSNRGELEETLVVVTADHGEGFGEESEYRSVPSVGHGELGGVEEPILHVPLVVQQPGQTMARTISDVATLTRFAEVVRSLLEDEHVSFVPDGSVFSTDPGMSHLGRQLASGYLDDLSEYLQTADVVYRQRGETTEKFIDWKGECLAVEMETRTSSVVDEKTAGWVEGQLETIRPKGLLEESGASIDDRTMQHLEDLGYA